MSVARIETLWLRAPWTLRIYVGAGVLLGVLCAAIERTIYSELAAALFIVVSYFLLKGVRWLWILLTASTVIVLLLWLLAWRIPALYNLVPLALLLAAPTRRHFGRGSLLPRVSLGKMASRLTEAPTSLRLFSIALFFLGVVGWTASQLSHPPGNPASIVIATLIIVGLIAAIAYLALRGSRLLWIAALGLLIAATAGWIVRGDWTRALLLTAFLVPLLLPSSVAFVWRDRHPAQS